jgi:hypothetical protein
MIKWQDKLTSFYIKWKGKINKTTKINDMLSDNNNKYYEENKNSW